MFWGDDESEGKVGVDGAVEVCEGGFGAELGERRVDLIVLEDEDAIKQAVAPRDGSVVLDAGEGGELMGGEVGEVRVEAAEEIGGGEGRVGLGADGEVIDEGADDAFRAREVGRPAGEGGAVDDIGGTGGVGEEGGPGGLGEDTGREAETAGGGG